jgi:hypothetical protein
MRVFEVLLRFADQLRGRFSENPINHWVFMRLVIAVNYEVLSATATNEIGPYGVAWSKRGAGWHPVEIGVAPTPQE